LKIPSLSCAVFSSVVLAVFCILQSPTNAQSEITRHENVAAMSSETMSYGPSQPKELESFLDSLLNERMDKLRIPGLVFVMVKDGDIFFAKGYGYADLEEKRPVIPDKTLFRVGSVSKLFTATAVMQLYEQGRIRLDADVNEYLKYFHLDEDFSEPITMANLLTHSAGFRGSAIGSTIRSVSEVMPLRDCLASKAIRRPMPPGQVINYSNYGYNLAGYLVEEISGIPFAKYIDKNILQPLGMKQSSFDLMPHQAPELAKSYIFNNGRYEIVPHEYGSCWPAPCGSLIATATDMAHFMIAHLKDGRDGDTQILRPETAHEMHQQHFTNHPSLPGMCYGFYEYYGNDLRGIFHDGDLSAFSSRLFLIPDHNLGIFICQNGGPSGFRMQLTTALLNRYFPSATEPALPQPPADFAQRAELFAGGYRSVRQDVASLDKLRTVSDLLNIASSDQSIIWIETQTQWVEIDSLLFQYAEGTSRMAFREDSQSNITHLFLDLKQIPIAYERVSWYDMPTFTWGSLYFFCLVFLSSFIIWPIMRRRRSRRTERAENQLSHRLPRLLAISSVTLNSIFIIGFASFMSFFIDELEYGVPLLIKALLVIPIVTAILTATLLLFAVLSWRHRYWSSFERWHYSLVALTCTAFVIWCHHWNLLGFHY